MHTTTIGETTFIHNGDFSGDVEVIIVNESIKIPFVDIMGFVAEYVRRERINQFEAATAEEILLSGGPLP